MLGRRFPDADCGLRAISAETETALECGEAEAAELAAGDDLGRMGRAAEAAVVEGAAETAGRTEVGEGRSQLPAAAAAAAWCIRPE